MCLIFHDNLKAGPFLSQESPVTQYPQSLTGNMNAPKYNIQQSELFDVSETVLPATPTRRSRKCPEKSQSLKNPI